MRPGRRSPRTRLILTLAALASLIGGYYAGQYWQRRPLAAISAIVYPAARPIDYPQGLGIATDPGSTDSWRLFLTTDTRVAQCRSLLHHLASMLNRLAARPDIQQRLRVALLAYDHPDAEAVMQFSGGADWVEVIPGQEAELDRLSGQLGILPATRAWCEPSQANGILVAPDRKAWALIPYEQAAIMADNIRTIIDFVE